MAALSSGHFAVDFASGSVPALIPFLTARFNLNYALAGGAAARGDDLLVARPAPVRSLVGPPGCPLADPRRGGPSGDRHRRRGGLARVPARRRARVRRRARRRRLPSRGREVRRLCERRQAGERHVVLQHRRQHRLRARGVRDGPARGLARAGRRAARDGARAGRLGGACPRRPATLAAEPSAAGGDARARRRPARSDGAPRRGDRPPQRRLVHAARLRAALGRRARPLEGGRQPAALR